MSLDRRKLTLECPVDNIPKKDDNNLRMIRGDSVIFEFTATDPTSGVSVDLTNVVLAKFSVKRKVVQGQGNDALVFQKLSSRPGEITIEAIAGLVFVELLATDTVEIDPGEYRYDLQLTFSDGRILTLVNDHLQIVEDITLEGTPSGQQYDPVITSKGQYFKRTALRMLRVMLKDFKLAPNIQAFGDEELNVFLEVSISDFNAQPMFTAFDWNNMENRWLGLICRGAFVMALYAQGLLEQGREFTITDNGISFTPPGLGAYMQSTAGAIATQYQKEKEDIKGNMKPAPHYLGTFRTLSVLPSFIRLRHLRERTII